ncbi:MAG: hypothetical protein KC620_18530, partial [Myxococcales bacterium]|nr:hypothetical protein [Myxococcales bacterium]
MLPKPASPSPRALLRLLAAFSAIVGLAPAALAQPMWPADNEWLALERDSQPVTDPTPDANGERNIVGDAANPAAYIDRDADYFYFRLRLDDDAIRRGTYRPFGWGVMFDTNLNTDDYEFLHLVDGIANPDIVAWQQNTQQNTIGDPQDRAEVELMLYDVAVYARTVPAPSNFSGNADFFIDWALPVVDAAAAGVPLDRPIRLIFGTSSNAQSLNADLMSSTDGVTLADAVTDPVLCDENGCINACTGSPDTDMDGFCDAVDNCVGDANPNQADLDGDGIGDLCDPTDDRDQDLDGLTNAEEALLGTDPLDADTDDDGLNDGDEQGRGTDPLDPDTDADGLQDGTEAGVAAPGPGTDPAVFVPDADPSTVTDPLNVETDGDGLPDGAEDTNHNGRLDPGESDASLPDTDFDGLDDGVERGLGTDPADADSDDDGVGDGDEVNGTGPVAPWGVTDPLDTDTDGDGVQDGTEVGLTLADLGPDTDPAVFVPDADPSTQTDPTRPDTDGDGIPDLRERELGTDPTRADSDGDG